MNAFIDFEKKVELCESQAQRQHLIGNYDYRVDWKGIGVAKLRVRLIDVGQPNELRADIDTLRPRLVRQYRCDYCEEVYGPFSVVCPCCFTVNLGTPTRATAVNSTAEIFSTSGLDVDVLESLSWDLLLQSSEVDSGE